jgi:tetratricopeptide (TPR) repeat protein
MGKLMMRLVIAATVLMPAGAQAATSNAAMEDDILAIALRWEHIKFVEDGAPDQFDDIDKLAKDAARLVAKYPGRPEPMVWQGIVTSEEAGMASMLHAMGYAKQARKILEKAYKLDPKALDAGAATSLGVLYYRVPGFPFGFGDNDQARSLLKEALTLAPDGMDANYFYADFLMTQHEYAAADKVLHHALALPERPDRPLWDQERRAVIKQLIAKAEAH